MLFSKELNGEKEPMTKFTSHFYSLTTQGCLGQKRSQRTEASQKDLQGWFQNRVIIINHNHWLYYQLSYQQLQLFWRGWSGSPQHPQQPSLSLPWSLEQAYASDKLWYLGSLSLFKDEHISICQSCPRSQGWPSLCHAGLPTAPQGAYWMNM